MREVCAGSRIPRPLSAPVVRRRDRRRADGDARAGGGRAAIIGAVPVGGWHIVLCRDAVTQPARQWRGCAG